MFTLYSKDACPGCRTALAMIKASGTSTVVVKKLDEDYTLAELRALIPGVKSVPQVFHDREHIGGVRELQAYLAKLNGH